MVYIFNSVKNFNYVHQSKENIVVIKIIVILRLLPSIVARSKQWTWGIIGEDVTSATVLSLVCGLFQAF